MAFISCAGNPWNGLLTSDKDMAGSGRLCECGQYAEDQLHDGRQRLLAGAPAVYHPGRHFASVLVMLPVVQLNQHRGLSRW